jgi:hypothetical protein
MSEVLAHLVERAESNWFVQLPSAQPATVVKASSAEQAIGRYCELNGIILSNTHVGMGQQFTVFRLEE